MHASTQGARTWILWFLAMLLLVPATAARAQAQRVQEVQVRGNQRINRESILSVVSTKPGDELSPERLERDRRAIEGLGWFNVVTVVLENGGQRVVFVVTEWPVVQQLQIPGSSIYTPEQIQAVTKTRSGQVFNVVDWMADLAAIQKLYESKGHVVRIVDNRDQPDFTDKGILKAEIQELKVGKVILKWPTREIKDKQGNVVKTVEQHKTRDYVVLRELSQKPGALYNEQKVGDDAKKLNELGYFESARPSIEVAEDLTVTITWTLTEKRTGQVSVGAGYSAREQLIGRVELADQNLQGKGRSASISAEMGTFGGDGAPSFEFQFHEPWLTKDHTSATIALYNKLVYRFSTDLGRVRGTGGDVDRYFERRAGGQISFGRPFQWPVTIGFRAEHVKTGDLPRGINLPVQNGNVFGVNVSRTITTRDDPQNPTEGHYIRGTAEFAHASMEKTNANNFGDSFFSKYILDTRKYIPLKRYKSKKYDERRLEAEKMPVLALRFMAGATIGDIPYFEQFFIGGSETLRGYTEDRFWGNYMYLASVEYRRPLMKRIVGVVFADVGDAFGSQSIFQFTNRRLRTEFEQHSGIRPYGAIGVGLRVATPIGPIRLDVGLGQEGPHTHFSIGHAF